MNGVLPLLRSRVLPLLWVLVLWLLALHIWFTQGALKGLSLDASFCVLPLAAYLGHRFGRFALVIVGLGCLPFLIYAQSHQVLLGGHADLFVLSLLVCAIAAKGEHWREWIPDIPPTRWFYFALLIWPCAASWRLARVGEFGISFEANFVWLYYLVLLLAGFRRLPAWPLFGAVIASSAFGLLVEVIVRLATQSPPPPSHGLVEVISLRNWSVTAYVEYPAALLSAVLYYAVGRNYRQMIDTGRPGIRSWSVGLGAVVVLALLATGKGIDRGLFPRQMIEYKSGSDNRQYFQFFSEPFLLPLAALCGGLWLRRTGVILVGAIAVAFWFLEYNVSDLFASEWRWMFRADLESLVTVIVFGWIGILMRREATKGVENAPVSHWLAFAAATFSLLREFLLPEEVESPEQLWPFLAGFVAVMLVVFAVGWWRRRRGWAPRTYASWIAILALIALVQVAVEGAGKARETMTQLSRMSWREMFSDGPVLYVGLIALGLYGWGCATALRTFLREAKEWYRDLLRIVRTAARLGKMKSLVEKIDRVIPHEEEREAPVPIWREATQNFLGIAQKVFFVVVVLAIGVIIFVALTE